MVKVTTQQSWKITVNSVLAAQSAQFSSFSILKTRIRFEHKHEKCREDP
jgi:hypothetical protein